MRTFSSGAIIKLLTVAADNADAQKFVLALAERVVLKFSEMRIPDFMPASFLPFQEAVDRIQEWCKCIIALLCPIPKHMGSSVGLVETLLNEKQMDFYMEESLRDALRDQDFWKSKLQAAREAAGAEAEFAGRIEKTIEGMKVADNIVQSMAAVKTALELRQAAQRHLRPGALLPLETIASKKVASIAKEVIASDASEKDGPSLPVDCDWLAQTLAALPPVGEDISGLLVRLSQWKEVNSGALTKRELTELAEKTAAGEKFQIQDLQRILDSMSKPDDGAMKDVAKDVDLLIGKMLEALLMKARFCRILC